MKRIALVLAFVLIGCADNYQKGYQDAESMWQQRMAHQLAVTDSVAKKAKEQKELMLLAELQCKKYAKIVSKNPSQVQFLQGWVNRAFEGIN